MQAFENRGGEFASAVVRSTISLGGKWEREKKIVTRLGLHFVERIVRSGEGHHLGHDPRPVEGRGFVFDRKFSEEIKNPK